MALVTFQKDDPVLTMLHTQFASLDSELRAIQTNYQSLCQLHECKCSAALSEATAGLLSIIKYVNKADKALVYWYEKGSTMKKALRYVGIDKRTEAIVERKTKKIKQETAKTEKQFDRTGEVLLDGLKAVQSLDAQVNQYSVSRVGSARFEASEACTQADSDAKQAECSLKQAQVEQRRVRAEIDGVSAQISGVETQREIAQNASAGTGAFALGSFVVASGAGLASFFCPPVAMLAVPAAGLCFGNTAAFCAYESQAADLRAKEASLVSNMGALRSQIESLELSIPELDKKRASYTQTKERVQELERRGESLQRKSKVMLDELLQARILLSNLQMRVQAIAVALSDCGYARTRREIASTLREILTELGKGVGCKSVERDSNLMARVSGKLSKVESQTTNVLLIMGSTR